MGTQLTKRREDLICFSHLRWGFVFQRPQHLMSRFARNRRVFFVEEAVYEDLEIPEMRIVVDESTRVTVVTPRLRRETSHEDACRTVGQMIRQLFRQKKIEDYTAWFYTPMALEFCGVLNPKAVVYDCMDELSLFRNAPPDIGAREEKLFELSDLVFTGGVSLFEAKRRQHSRVFPFPSCVDCAHFAQARSLPDGAGDQKDLPHPRIGYAGVIDERIDIEMLGRVAAARPEWQFIMVGPVVKVDPASLPRRANIHWLGMKPYSDLPGYFAGWDVAMMPFALNDSTRFISPTKTPEYLAAGLPVVSTPIRDVVRTYGELGLVHIAADAKEFLTCVEKALTFGMSLKWRERADAFLQTLSWDKTWSAMDELINGVVSAPAVSAMPVLTATRREGAPV